MTGHKFFSHDVMMNVYHTKKEETFSPTTRIEAIIFDFDGTLAELHLDFGEMRAAVGEVLKRHHLPAHEFAHLYLLEMIDAGEKRLAESTAGRSESFRMDAMACIENMEIEAAGRSNLFAGVREMLGEIRKQSILTGIITRNCHRAVQTVFPDYGAYVNVLISREMTQHVKPDPGHLAEMLSQLNISANRSLMVGDHPIDVQIGKELGAYTAAVLTGTGKHEDLRRAQPDFLLQNVLEIRDMLDSFAPHPCP